MELLLLQFLIVFVLPASVLGYAIGRLSKRPWLGWLIGVAIVLYGGFFVPVGD